MAKIIKVRRKRSLRMGSVVMLIMTLALTFSFVTSIFIRSENQRILKEIDETNTKISSVQAQNQDLVQQVNALSSYARVVEIAQEGGLDFIQGNRLYVRGE